MCKTYQTSIRVIQTMQQCQTLETGESLSSLVVFEGISLNDTSQAMLQRTIHVYKQKEKLSKIRNNCYITHIDILGII